MRILLTNDDGFDAPGMKILLDIAQHFSNDIWIVAPSDENSGAGHSLTITRPLRIRKRGDQQYSVDGTPTDSVMMAVAKIMKDGPPDLILSGVNQAPCRPRWKGRSRESHQLRLVRPMHGETWGPTCRSMHL